VLRTAVWTAATQNSELLDVIGILLTTMYSLGPDIFSEVHGIIISLVAGACNKHISLAASSRDASVGVFSPRLPGETNSTKTIPDRQGLPRRDRHLSDQIAGHCELVRWLAWPRRPQNEF